MTNSGLSTLGMRVIKVWLTSEGRIPELSHKRTWCLQISHLLKGCHNFPLMKSTNQISIHGFGHHWRNILDCFLNPWRVLSGEQLSIVPNEALSNIPRLIHPTSILNLNTHYRIPSKSLCGLAMKILSIVVPIVQP